MSKINLSPFSLAAAAVALAAFLLYARTAGNGFVAYDDPAYLAENPRVTGGLTREGLWWAATSVEHGNWHPLTRFSHQLDVQLFGLEPGPHHLHSALLHAAASGLLLLALTGMTGALWRSLLVAALWAVHPLHVESVAWASERKDVLSAFFWFLAILLYLRYARRPRASAYLAVAASFSLALMSKVMAVTLPLVLLLLDWWPLGRGGRGRPWPRLLLEKAPLATLSAGAVALALAAQRQSDAVGVIEEYPLTLRLANASISLVEYLWKTVWPVRLAAHYPYFERARPLWLVAAALLLASAVTFAAFLGRRRRPWLAAGWVWYLAVIFPVIGVVQVGSQRLADRYHYLPSVGLFVIVAWGLAGLAGRGRAGRAAAAGLAVAAVAVLVPLTWVQIGYWKDTVTLFTHAARVTERNWVAYSTLGADLMKQGRYAEAQEYMKLAYGYNRAFRADPYIRAGDFYLEKGNRAAAIESYRRALAIRPYDRFIIRKLREAERPPPSP